MITIESLKKAVSVAKVDLERKLATAVLNGTAEYSLTFFVGKYIAFKEMLDILEGKCFEGKDNGPRDNDSK